MVLVLGLVDFGLLLLRELLDLVELINIGWV